MSLGKRLASLALPMVAGQLAYAAMSFIDTLLLGQLGVLALAGGALGGAAFQFFYIVGIGVLVAAANHMAFAKGAEDHSAIQQSLLAGWVVVILLSVMCVIAMWHLKPLFLYLDQDLEASLVAERYLRVVVWAMFPAFLFVLYRSLALGLGDTSIILPVSLVAALANYPISYVLMHGLFGLPALGVEGVALGTCIVSVGMALSIIFFCYQKPAFQRYPFWRHWNHFSFARFKEIWTLGVPIAVAHAMEIGMFAAAALLIGTISVEALAAHQIVLQCATLSFMIPLGISQALSAQVGEIYGAQQYALLNPLVKRGLFAVTVTATLAGSAFWVFPEALASIFVEDPNVLNESFLIMVSQMFLVAAMFQLMDSYQVVLMGALRGFKLGVSPTVIAMVSYWGVGFSISYFSLQSFGAMGVWAGMGIGLAVSAILLGFLYHRFVTRLMMSGT